MTDKISINVDEVLEINYSVEEVSRDTITIQDKPSPETTITDRYVSTETYVFDPPEPGDYKIDVGGQIIDVQVLNWETVSNGSFESGDLTSWTNKNNGGISVSTTRSWSGNYSVQVPDGNDRQIIHDSYSSGPPLSLRYKVYIPTSTGSSYDLQLVFGYQDSNNFYAFSPRNIFNSKWFYKKENGSYTRIIDEGSSNYDPRGSWHTLYVEWRSDNTLYGEIVDESSSSTVWSISGSDSTFTSAGKVGIGHQPSGSQGVSYADKFEFKNAI